MGYPKALYGEKGFEDINDCIVVNDPQAEEVARAGGYRDLSEPDEAIPVPDIKDAPKKK